MSGIKELIQASCPQGVKRVKFSDCATYIRGVTYNKQQESTVDDDSSIRVLRANNITIGANVLNFEDVKCVKQEVKVKAEQWLRKDDILICAGSGSKEHVGKVAYITEDMNITFGGFMAVIRPKDGLLPRYLFHNLVGGTFKEYLKGALNSTTINNLSAGVMKDFEVFLPPVPVQEEIVRVLDSMTELQQNLQEELEARRKQYEAYREKLLTFNEIGGGITWSRIGDIMTIVRGASPRPIVKYMAKQDEGVPWIKIGDVKSDAKYIEHTAEYVTKEGAKKSRYLHKGDFILSNSMSFGRPYILALDGCIHDGWIAMSQYEDTLLPDYLYEVLRSSSVQSYWKMKANNGGAMSNLNSDIVKDTIIPVPSKDVQLSIVANLQCISDLNKNVQDELKARRVQYEYYREQLLSF